VAEYFLYQIELHCIHASTFTF